MVVITVPFAKPPKEETGAVEFASMLQGELEGRGVEIKMLFGEDHAEITNVETAQGKDTSYAHAYYEELKNHTLHLNIRSFEADDELFKDNDLILGYLPSTSKQSLYESLENLIDEYGVVSIIEMPYATHRLSLVSEVLFDTPSITLYLNEGAVDLFVSFSEEIADFVSHYEVQRTPLVDDQVSI
jgi:hypothetical protein